MSFDTDLKIALSPLVDGGCHNGVNLDPDSTEYVVFHEISSIPFYTITSSDSTDSRYQIDVIAKTPEKAKALALGVIKTAVEGLGARLIFHNKGEYSEATKTHQYITEYEVQT